MKPTVENRHPYYKTIEMETASIEMPRYICHKEVWALKILEFNGTPDRDIIQLTFDEPGYAPIYLDAQIVSRYKPVPGDYFVVYKDGYKSISPAKAFEDGYSKI